MVSSISCLFYSSTLVGAFFALNPLAITTRCSFRSLALASPSSCNRSTSFAFSTAMKASYRTADGSLEKSNGVSTDKFPAENSPGNGNPRRDEKEKPRKTRAKELENLSATLGMAIPQVKELLKKQRFKMESGSEKADLIDWMLQSETKEMVVEENSKKTEVHTMSKRYYSDNIAYEKEKTRKGPVRPRRPESTKKRVEEKLERTESRLSEALKDPSLLTNVEFSERTDLHPLSKRAIIEVMGLKSMTEIQAKTFAAASTGNDVLGRARTGTGKTVAFLLPAIERLLQGGEFRQNNRVGILVISPTRELASQIGVEAEKLLTFHKSLSAKVIFGGTNMNRDVTMLKRGIPSILVATPGRLLDHMENTKLAGLKFGENVMSQTNIVILDETDRLLDMGFRKEIKKILAYLPRKEKRQTLLFSATIPSDLKPILREQMKEDYVEVDCINDGDGASHTNQRVNQRHVVLPTMDHYVTSLVGIVQRSIDEDKEYHKIVVFFPTAMMVGFFAAFFSDGLGIKVIELHSKKSQSFRNKASENFRKAKRGVLFTSDVSARGVDYPDVTEVIQFGLPASREQYIHRLGRTGRAGKTGEGLLVLAPFEAKFLSELNGLDIPVDDATVKLLANPLKDDQALASMGIDCIRNGDPKLTPIAQKAYRAFLGFYTGQMKRTHLRSKEDLVKTANRLFEIIGLNETPKLEKRTIGKMGLRGVPGISIGKD